MTAKDLSRGRVFPLVTARLTKVLSLLFVLAFCAYQARRLHLFASLEPSLRDHIDHTSRPAQDLEVDNPATNSKQVNSGASQTNLEAIQAKIGMVTMVYGKPNDVYERALQSHIEYGKARNYPLSVLREKLLGRLWSKPAYVFSVLADELSKPRDQRLEWLFWFDADTYILNPQVTLETFLPPSPAFDHINFLCADDHNGLNDGAFLIRVNGWSLRLMSHALSVETFRPEVSMKYSEQSAIEYMVKNITEFRDATAIIPQRWLNAYMGPRDEAGKAEHPEEIKGNSVKNGDLQLHFVGSGDTKKSRMTTFMDSYEKSKSEWVMPLESTKYQKEIDHFWKTLPKKPSEDGVLGGAEASTERLTS